MSLLDELYSERSRQTTRRSTLYSEQVQLQSDIDRLNTANINITGFCDEEQTAYLNFTKIPHTDPAQWNGQLATDFQSMLTGDIGSAHQTYITQIDSAISAILSKKSELVAKMEANATEISSLNSSIDSLNRQIQAERGRSA